MSSQYLNLRIGAARRLAVLRLDADTWNAKHPHAPLQNPTWREMRFGKFTYWAGLSPGYNCEARTAWGKTTETRVPVSTTHDGPAFKREFWADECVKLNHTGWYTDREDCDATYRGLVVALPHGRFIVGYYSSDNGERVYFRDLHSDKNDAAHAADDVARIWAEREADYQERRHAAENLQDHISERKEEFSRAYALRHHKQHGSTREELAELIDAIREDAETLATDYKDIEL